MLMPPVEDGGWVPKWVRWGRRQCAVQPQRKNHARGTRDERGAFEQSEKVEKCAWWARTSSAVEERRAGFLREAPSACTRAWGFRVGGSTGGEWSEAMGAMEPAAKKTSCRRWQGSGDGDAWPKGRPERSHCLKGALRVRPRKRGHERLAVLYVFTGVSKPHTLYLFSSFSLSWTWILV